MSLLIGTARTESLQQIKLRNDKKNRQFAHAYSPSTAFKVPETKRYLSQQRSTWKSTQQYGLPGFLVF